MTKSHTHLFIGSIVSLSLTYQCKNKKAMIYNIFPKKNLHIFVHLLLKLYIQLNKGEENMKFRNVLWYI